MDVKKLFSFDGRIGRGTLWKLIGAYAVIMGLIGLIASSANNAFLTFLAVVMFLVMAVAGIATHVKRWHDRDKSGAWYFLSFVPIVGPIWTLIELGFLPGTDGPNQYGLPDSGSPFAGEALPYDATVVSPQQREWGR